MITTLTSLFSFGFLLSAYAVYVHYRSSKDSNYKSACDLSDKTSCSDTFTSEYGSHFGIPNGYYGMGFYILMIILINFDHTEWVFYLSVTSLIVSCYLAYLLITKVKRVCLDCIAIYIVNIVSFIILWNLLY